MAGAGSHHHISRVEGEQSDEFWCPASFLLVIHSRIPAHGMVLTTLRVGPNLENPYGHAKRFVSMVTLNLGKLTTRD